MTAAPLTPAFVHGALARLAEARGRTPTFFSLHATDDRPTAIALLEWALADGVRLVAASGNDPRFATTLFGFRMADRYEVRQLVRADYQLAFLNPKTDIVKVDDAWEAMRPILAWTLGEGQTMVETLAAEMPVLETAVTPESSRVAAHVAAHVSTAAPLAPAPRVTAAPRLRANAQLGLI
jgi:hypothetical protein